MKTIIEEADPQEMIMNEDANQEKEESATTKKMEEGNATKDGVKTKKG